MAYFGRHGGDCCGINHLYEWGTSGGDVATPVDNQENYKKFSEEVDKYSEGEFEERDGPKEGRCVVIEVVLTDLQIENSPHFAKWLKRKGFKIVNRFRNYNSGNFCTVFHYTQYPISKTVNNLPFKW